MSGTPFAKGKSSVIVKADREKSDGGCVKGKLHILGAFVGLACAASFAMIPFSAHADAGPAKKIVAPVIKKDSGPIKKKHMNRGHVAKNDDGCAE